FFQAEDGIRDYKVTGVQTCALPIFGGTAGSDRLGGPQGGGAGGREPTLSHPEQTAPECTPVHIVYLLDISMSMKDRNKIGKAKEDRKSVVRERVKTTEGDEA